MRSRQCKLTKLKMVGSLLLILCILFFPLNIAAKNGTEEDDTAGQFISHAQPAPEDDKNEGMKVDLFSVGFILLSIGTFFAAAASHWLYHKRKTMLDSQASATAMVNEETNSLKEYLDNARAIKNFDLSLVFSDFAAAITKLQQMENTLKTNTNKIVVQREALRADISRAFEQAIRRCL